MLKSFFQKPNFFCKQNFSVKQDLYAVQTGHHRHVF